MILMREYKAYVDGSYRDGLCGYGIVIVDQDDNVVIELYGDVCDNFNMHNVTGELKAAEHAILWAYKGNSKVTIYHDYEGIGAWATGKWKARKLGTVAYRSFVLKHRDHIGGFVKVKGHSGDIYNQMADELATRGIEEALESC